MASAIVAGVNPVLTLRSRSLLSGVKELVNDPGFTGLARMLCSHAAINPRGTGVPGSTIRWPPYIEPA